MLIRMESPVNVSDGMNFPMFRRIVFGLFLVSCVPDPEPVEKAPKPIPTVLEPEIIQEESEVIYVLSSFETKYKYEGSFESRANNIELASDRLNNFELEPNREFSFNEVVGERTDKTGFKMAPIYFDGIKTDGMGGGVCQVSSTLYAAAMYGHLTITQRTSHTRPSSYIPIGLDATVSYPELDLKFTNPYKTKLRIVTTTDEGVLRIYFFGKEKDFDVKHKFGIKKFIPYGKRVITRSYQRREPFIHQKGRDGTPGWTFWTYIYWGNKVEKLRVFSDYDSVDEIWYAGPDAEIEVEDGGTENTGSSEAGRGTEEFN
jgi:hypothetical protein